jgi:hypothetical protein
MVQCSRSLDISSGDTSPVSKGKVDLASQPRAHADLLQPCNSWKIEVMGHFALFSWLIENAIILEQFLTPARLRGLNESGCFALNSNVIRAAIKVTLPVMSK